jgi:cellulose synthase operon protein YhjQ
MTDRAADQIATPVDIATLYSRANVQGTKYWDFSASRTQVRGQFRHPLVREEAERVEPQGVQEQAEQAQPQAVQAEPAEQQEALPQGQPKDDVLVPQLEPEAGSEEVLMLQADPPSEMPEMTPSEPAEPQTPAGPTLWAGSKVRREESGPGPLVQWPSPQRQGTGPASAAGGEALPHPKGGVASRWYALQSVFPRPEEAMEAPEAPPVSHERRPPMVLVFSLAGGVGKTCLVATLGRALSALGERVLLADTVAHGLLPFYFGSPEFNPQSRLNGLVRTFYPPGSERATPVQVLSLEAERYPADSSEHDPLLGELVGDGRGVNRILVDLATRSRDVTTRLLFLHPTVLVPILPDMSSVASLGSLEAFLARASGGSNEPLYLLNQFDASSPLHLDVREMLRDQLGDRLLPFVLRRCSAVSEALAEGMTVIDYAPGSAVAKDYWDLAGWLRSLEAPAAVGYGALRCSER